MAQFKIIAWDVDDKEYPVPTPEFSTRQEAWAWWQKNVNENPPREERYYEVVEMF